MAELQNMLKGKKVSEIFNEYASPAFEVYIDQANYSSLDELTIEEMQAIIQLPWTIWNAAVSKHIGKNKIDFLGSITLLTKDAPEEAKDFIKFMCKRKETKFKKYNFFLGEFKLTRNPLTNQFILTMEARL